MVLKKGHLRWMEHCGAISGIGLDWMGLDGIGWDGIVSGWVDE